MNADHCLINQTACGRIQGDPVCPKCGMDERVVYPGQADLAAALESARARYVAAQEAVEPPRPPESPKPPAPPEPPPQPPKQPNPEPLTPLSGEKTSLNRLGLGVLVVALLGGGWWWKDQQDLRLQQAEEQAASQALAAEQARSEREAEKKRADQAEAQRGAAEKAQAQIAEQIRREREAEKKRAEEAEAQRMEKGRAQAQVAEQARRERESEKKRADEAEILRVAAERAQVQNAEQARREREAEKLRADKAERPTLLHGRYQILAGGSEVRDVQTGLVWARCSVGQAWNGSTCTGQAKMFVPDQAHQLAGNGWRVPTVRELASLVYCSTGETRDIDEPQDGGRPIANACRGTFTRPTIWNEAFPNTPEVWFFAFSTSAGRLYPSWGVGFDDGNLSLGGRGDDFPRFRLVRASQ